MVALIAAIIELVLLILRVSLDAASDAKKAKKEYEFKRDQFDKLVQIALVKMQLNAAKDKKESDKIDDQLDGR